MNTKELVICICETRLLGTVGTHRSYNTKYVFKDDQTIIIYYICNAMHNYIA